MMEGTLSVPGTADYVVSVGACSSEEDLSLAPFSSRGPTRDGRLKPDLCAPGLGVVSALANMPGGDDVVDMDGTSMAAPHVTGAVALTYSRLAAAGVPFPTVAEIIGELRRQARPVGTFHPAFGSGVLDIVEFINALTARYAPNLDPVSKSDA
ncbi:MAG: S8 family serine peptidase [Pseudomonadota bacterium]